MRAGCAVGRERALPPDRLLARFGGHRRQSTFFCTHLASHGYVVAAADHTGNTTLESCR